MHVPEENLTKYRALKRIADQFDRLGSSFSNIGEYHKANWAWGQSCVYLAEAYALRVLGKKEAVESPT